MISFLNQRVLLRSAIASLSLIFITFSATASPQQQNDFGTSIQGTKVMLMASDVNENTTVPAPIILPQSERLVNIVVNYNGFTANAQTAFQAAVDIWESILVGNQTINITANWTPLDADVLGSASSAFFHWNFTGAPLNNTAYPTPLANELCGCDLTPGVADLTANFNSNFGNWYLGTDGATPAGQFDFMSVVLHEIGHGLGFAGSATVDGAGVGGFLWDNVPAFYDTFVDDVNFSILAYADPSPALTTALQGGGNLMWNGANAVAGNGGAKPELFDPNPWNPGSSYSHFAESYFLAGDVNSLMTPSIGTAEAIHDPGPACLGLLEDLGWGINYEDVGSSDNEGPDFSGTDDVVEVPCDDIDAFNAITASPTDPCTPITLTFEDIAMSGGCVDPVGNYLREYTATDDCGNTSTFLQLIVLTDNIPPAFTTFPSDITITCDSDLPGLGSVYATDNCAMDVITIDITVVGGSCPDAHEVHRTYTAYDSCGNTTTSTQVIFIEASDVDECLENVGCTDPVACNYDPDACTESGSCEYCNANCVNVTLFDSYGDGWNGATWSIMDEMGVHWAGGELLSGYEMSESWCLDSGCYTFDVTSGDYPSEVSWELVGANGGVITGGASESMSVSFGDVEGCTNPIACNYDPDACIDDGSCDYYYSPPTNLLDTEWYIEYDWGCDGFPGDEVWTLNSDYTYTTEGNPGIWSLCGLSVTLLFESGTEYNGDYNLAGGYFEGTINGGSGCFTMWPAVEGCTESTACNYNAYANVDDGSCNNQADVVDMTGADWILDYDANCAGGVTGGGSLLTLFYADNTWEFVEYSDNGWWTLCGSSLEVWNGSDPVFIGEWSWEDFAFTGLVYDNGVEFGCGLLYLQVEGCTDPIACNYDASANLDDGSCQFPTCNDPLACNYDECSDPTSICYNALDCYDASTCTYAIAWSPGCTYSDATNYDPTATFDDGSCEYDLPSICGSGTYFDATTGTCLPDGTGTGDGCPGDLNDDGFVNTNDLLAFLAVFGNACP
jgi:hypothetical protein